MDQILRTGKSQLIPATPGKGFAFGASAIDQVVVAVVLPPVIERSRVVAVVRIEFLLRGLEPVPLRPSEPPRAGIELIEIGTFRVVIRRQQIPLTLRVHELI